MQDGNDYIVSLSKKAQATNLNGKAINENDLNAIELDIKQIINSTITPPTPMMMPTPASNTKGYNCYWMENRSGKNEWVLLLGVPKSRCFELDSCSDGLKQSNGGCYKWATSPDAKPEPWNQPVNNAVQH